MALITPNKSDSVVVIAHQAAVHPTTIKSADMDASTKRRVVLFLFHGYVEAVADTNPGKFLIQARPDNGGGAIAEHWITVHECVARGTTPDTEALTATEAIGSTVLEVVSTTGFAVEDELYIQDTGVLADSEWARLRLFATNASITLMDGLTTAKDNTDIIWNDASKFVVELPLDGIESYRVIWTHEGVTGADGHIKVLAITYDSDTVA